MVAIRAGSKTLVYGRFNIEQITKYMMDELQEDTCINKLCSYKYVDEKSNSISGTP